MDSSCLQYCLTETERCHFEEQGYLIVEEALPQDKIDLLIEAVDEIYKQKLAEGFSPYERFFLPNFVGRNPLFIELVDWPRIFPKVWGILGWNIYLYHSHLGVDPPQAPGVERVKKTLGWHQDSGRVNVEIETHPRPRLSLKVAYFLTDLTEPGRANLWIIPGSHLKDSIVIPSNGVDNPEGAMPVCVKPGTAVLFDRRLWHAASPNFSSYTPKVLFYGYGYRWLRTKDDITIPPEVMEKSDPIRRQILGEGVNANGRYSPTDADVPLRVWLREQGLEEAKR